MALKFRNGKKKQTIKTLSNIYGRAFLRYLLTAGRNSPVGIYLFKVNNETLEQGVNYVQS